MTISTRLDEIFEMLGNLDGRMERIEHEVCGNGQPGLTARVAAIEETAGDLKRWRDGSFRRALIQWVVTIVTAAFGSHVPLPPQ